MGSKQFSSAINCMDGRVQEPAIKFLKNRYQTSYIDNITLPGPEKALSTSGLTRVHESTREKLEISIHHHGSEKVAIFAHHDCAGNPANRSEKEKQLQKAAGRVRAWFPEVTVETFYINEKWEVKPVSGS